MPSNSGSDNGGGNTPPFDLSQFLQSPYNNVTITVCVHPNIPYDAWSLNNPTWVYEDQEVMDAIDEMLNSSDEFPLGEELIRGVINDKPINPND